MATKKAPIVKKTDAKTLTSNDYYAHALAEVQKDLGGINVMALPKIDKIVINAGIGKYEKAQKDEIVDLVEKLTGQIPKRINSTKSISGFKLRAGDMVGVSVTLRGQKMRDFLLNLIYLSLPRTKDFKGVSKTAWDQKHATYSLGIKDASIFPQIGFSVKVNFGMQVNICFKHSGKNNELLLTKLQFPFSKI